MEERDYFEYWIDKVKYDNYLSSKVKNLIVLMFKALESGYFYEDEFICTQEVNPLGDCNIDTDRLMGFCDNVQDIPYQMYEYLNLVNGHHADDNISLRVLGFDKAQDVNKLVDEMSEYKDVVRALLNIIRTGEDRSEL